MEAVRLRPHQQDALAKLHNGCILRGGVGSGKSITSLAYYVQEICGGTFGDFGSMRTPTDLYIITTAKQRDNRHWNLEAWKFGISDERDSSAGGVKLTVDSWNNIGKYTEVKDAFFIFDEQRVVGSGHWTKSFIKIAKANRWILLSATPGDTWLDYIPVFVANGFYKNRTEFKREHVVYNTFTKYPKVDRYIGVNRLLKHRNSILVQMPYITHTTRHLIDVPVNYNQEEFDLVWNKRWNVYESRPLKDVADLFRVARKVVNSDTTRLETIRELMSVHPRLIVFYNFDYELTMLRTLAEGGSLTERTLSDSASSSSSSRGRRTGSSTGSTTSSSSPQPDPLAGTIWEKAELQKIESERSFKSSTATHSTPSEEVSPTRTRRHSSKSSSSQEKCSSETDTGRQSLPTGSDQIQNPDQLDQTATVPVANFSMAEWNGHKHEEIPDSERWVYLVQYTAGAEGWNCVETDAMVFFSLTYSYKQFHQAHGRIDRMNTPFKDLYYYVLWAGSPIEKIIRKSLKQKKSFNESDYKHLF